MLFVVDLNDAPWIATPANFSSVGAGDFRVGANNRKGDLGHDLVVLGDRLIIIELIARTFEDLNVMVFDIREDLDTSVSTVKIEK